MKWLKYALIAWLLVSWVEVHASSLVINSSGSTTGTITAGTSNTMSPFAANTKSTVAHGLGATPAFVIAYAECLTAEQGYSIGDRISLVDTGSTNGWHVEWDATNTVILANSSALAAVNKTTPAGAISLTAANWKLVVVPYRIN